MKRAIVNRGKEFSELDGVITKTTDVLKVIAQSLKQGNAKLLLDTDDTLMYELKEQP